MNLGLMIGFALGISLSAGIILRLWRPQTTAGLMFGVMLFIGLAGAALSLFARHFDAATFLTWGALGAAYITIAAILNGDRSVKSRIALLEEKLQYHPQEQRRELIAVDRKPLARRDNG
jgi:hypothetical protein